MKIIARDIQPIIQEYLIKGKMIIVYGARQVGKTVLVKTILDQFPKTKLYLNCDLLSVRESLSFQDSLLLKRVIGDAELIVIDEAQRVENIGLILKILHDTYPDLQIIATGSSSFELANKMNEPLTGRALEFSLFPFSFHELRQIYTFIDLQSQIDFHLVFGSYPEIATASQEDARLYLENLISKYLYKDILEFERLKKPQLLLKLLQLLSFQLGNEVSRNELAVNLQVNRETIDRYLDLLEQAFVIFRLKPLSRNLRKEITKKEKIYFYDLGIRNGLINNFNSVKFRQDIGALWENFCIMERWKYRQRMKIYGDVYFWRTHDQKEIDYVENIGGRLYGYEFKYQQDKYQPPAEFLNVYQGSSAQIINKSNLWEFIGVN